MDSTGNSDDTVCPIPEQALLDKDYERVADSCGDCPETKTCADGSSVNCACLNNEVCMCESCSMGSDATSLSAY